MNQTVDAPRSRREPDRTRSDADGPLAVELIVDYTRGERTLSVNLDLETLSQHDSSARLAVETADHSYSISYKMFDSVRAEIARIGNIYPTVGDAPGRTTENLSPIGKLFPHKTHHTSSVTDKVHNLLQWQKFIELLNALPVSTTPKSGAAKAHDLLANTLTVQFMQGFRTLRSELRNERDGGKIVRSLLYSNNEMLVDIGVRLAEQEPSLRAAVQQELVSVYRDHAFTTDLRQRAYTAMEQSTRHAIHDQTAAEHG